MNMEELQDFYIDSFKRKFEVKLVGENLAYLRSDSWGHIRNIVAPIIDGVPDLTRAREFSERTEAIAHIYREEQKYPERYITTQAREILARYGHCPDCNQ